MCVFFHIHARMNAEEMVTNDKQSPFCLLYKQFNNKYNNNVGVNKIEVCVVVYE